MGVLVVADTGVFKNLCHSIKINVLHLRRNEGVILTVQIPF